MKKSEHWMAVALVLGGLSHSRVTHATEVPSAYARKQHNAVPQLRNDIARAVPLTLAQAASPSHLPPPPLPPPAAEPPLAVPVSVHGSYFTRYELRENYDKLGVSAGRFQEGDRAVYRFRTSITTGPMDIGGDKAVMLHFAPQASGFYPGAGTASNTNATVGESDLGVVEGYLRLKTPDWDLDVGRFIMNYGISAVIGSLDWHQSARSFQGARWMLHLPEKAFVDLFMTQQAEGAPGERAFARGDEYFTGAYAGLGSLVPGLNVLDVYALAKVWGGRAPTEMSEKVSAAMQATLGSLVKGDLGPLDYIVEGGVQFGKRRVAPMMVNVNRDVLAYNIDGELGLKLGGFRVAGYGAYASGEDGTGKLNSWDELYPTTHMFFGLMDIIGIRSNIADAALRLSYAAPANLLFKFDFHNFFRPEDANSALMGSQDGYAGSEGNLHVIHKLGKGLVLRAMYGFFVPNDEIYARKDAAHYLEVELRYDI